MSSPGPKYEKELQTLIDDPVNGESLLREILRNCADAPSVPVGALAAAVDALLQYNKGEWREWQAKNS